MKISKCLKHPGAFCFTKSQNICLCFPCKTTNEQLFTEADLLNSIHYHHFSKTVTELINAHDQRNAFSAYPPGLQQQLHV